ncbi:hypothetical protein ACSLBF_18870 (plasmid) [Pseudoalteromonas sp. T1lg65]|uniref:hypothetical protein n=1 Tax=Pseudoalteromonas sp. T1lg65 TaxID=2077101 RepID=UPI003F79CD8A
MIATFRNSLLILCLIFATTSWCQTVVKVVDAELVNGTPQNRYFLAVLQLALDKSQSKYGEAWLKKVDLPINQSRQFREIAKGNTDVFWTMFSLDRAELATPVPIPIAFGSYGIRVLVAKPTLVNEFAEPMSLEVLKTYPVYLGRDWPDVKVFKNNGFKVQTFRDSSEIQAQLTRTPEAIFPRGLIELPAELALLQRSELAFSQHHLIVYPAPMYFFINKKNIGLYQRLEYGLSKAMEDGSLAKLFFQSELFMDVKRHFSHAQQLSVHYLDVADWSPSATQTERLQQQVLQALK